MHIKFIPRGKGSAKDAELYTLRSHDHKGEIRVDVQVLRGNPSFVSELADSLEFKHRYTSGVIAWHVDDNPSEKDIAQVLNDFERVAFAGLDASQYAYYAVLHEESNGAKHVHVVSARVELTTGKSMNIAPPNWQKTYDVLVDKYNVKNGWASPKDLHRRKLVNNQIDLHSTMSHTKAKVEINKAVMELVAQGTIQNENDVIKYLNSIDGVTVKPRRSNKSLSIELEGIKKPIRLEGLAYAKGFDVRELRQELRAEQESRAEKTTAERAREHERVSEVLESIIADRAKFNRGRYDQKAQVPKRENDRREKGYFQGRKGNSKDFDQQQKGNREGEPKLDAELEQNQAKVLDSSPDSGRVIDIGANTRHVSPWELDNKPSPRPTDTKSRDSQDREDQRQVHNQKLEQRHRSEEAAKRLQEHGRGALDSSIRENERVINDTVRARIKANLESTRRAIQERVREYQDPIRERVAGHEERLSKAYGESHEFSGRADKHHREAERSTQEVRAVVLECADKHRRGTSAELDRQSQSLEQKVGLIGRARQGLIGAIKQCVEKAIVKVKEIAKTAERTYTQSFGHGGMSP